MRWPICRRSDACVRSSAATQRNGARSDLNHIATTCRRSVMPGCKSRSRRMRSRLPKPRRTSRPRAKRSKRSRLAARQPLQPWLSGGKRNRPLTRQLRRRHSCMIKLGLHTAMLSPSALQHVYASATKRLHGYHASLASIRHVLMRLSLALTAQKNTSQRLHQSRQGLSGQINPGKCQQRSADSPRCFDAD